MYFSGGITQYIVDIGYNDILYKDILDILILLLALSFPNR